MLAIIRIYPIGVDRKKAVFKGAFLIFSYVLAFLTVRGPIRLEPDKGWSLEWEEQVHFSFFLI